VTKAENYSLMQVIAKIKNMAESDYDNKIYDNILTIFNRLMIRDRKILLKGLINICFIIDDKTLVDNNDLEKVKLSLLDTKESLAVGLRSIEEYNELELIKLKTWLVKALSIGLLVMVACFILLGIKIGSDNGTMGNMLKNMFEYVKMIFVV